MTEVKPFHLALFLLAMVCSVWGDYVAEVYVYTYNNPSSFCQSCRFGDSSDNQNLIGCCDTFERETCTGTQLCDNQFTFCWRPLTTDPDHRASACQSNTMVTGIIDRDDDSFVFNSNGVLGLSNPLSFSMQGPWTAQQFYVEVFDDDTLDGAGGADFVDSVSIPVVDRQINRAMYTGYFGLSNIELSFQVNCAQNFFGPNCDLDLSQCSSAVCSGNGQCIAGGGTTCNCDTDYTGADCSINIVDHCEAVTCSGNGDCEDENNSFNCVCDSGYTGLLCETNIDDCQAVNCNGNGACQDQVDSFVCLCNAGYTGTLCEMNIDDCQAVDCSGNGACQDQVDSFVCLCNAGYTGTLCEMNIDDCEGVDCSGNGNCNDEILSFSCVCHTGYTGSMCEINIDDCQAVDCSGNGACQDQVDSFVCLCDAGYTGTLCEININDCEEVDCSGNGVCIDGVASYICVCNTGYTGTQCSIFLPAEDLPERSNSSTDSDQDGNNNNIVTMGPTPQNTATIGAFEDNITVENVTTSSRLRATPLLVGGIIGEFLGAFFIAVIIVVSGVTLGRVLKHREMKYTADLELEMNKSSEEIVMETEHMSESSVSSV